MGRHAGPDLPKVFISYARADAQDVDALDAALRQAGVTVWRDQDKLYAGQRWPKALGAAIAAQDAVVLMWSRAAADSEFVELEWCTAVALKKPILPVLLDGTPLPPSLSAIHAIESEIGARAIIGALGVLRGRADVRRQADVFAALDTIPADEPRAVLDAAKTLFAQRHWRVEGSVYQAAGDIHITQVNSTGGGKSKSLLESWSIRIGIVAGALTIFVLLLDIPEKIARLLPPDNGAEEQTLLQPLAGSVRSEANDPLTGVAVSLPTLGMTVETDDLGRFVFEVVDSPQATVELMAQKPGYRTHEQYATLGNTQLSFTLRRSEP